MAVQNEDFNVVGRRMRRRSAGFFTRRIAGVGAE
jgi:hypothetical protein